MREERRLESAPRGERTCGMREGLDHRRECERLVSLVRLSSELALPVEKSWLACGSELRITFCSNLLALVLV